MSYLESLPRRLVTLYLPLFIILVVLLFPFYWMALTSIKPDEQLIDMETYNPFWVVHPTFKHISKLLFETAVSALALEHDVCGGRRHRRCRSSPACWRPMPSCGCGSRARTRSAC